MKCITENPFRILGLYTNAKEREVARRVNDLGISLNIGKSLHCESDFPIFSTVNRTPESVSDAANKIEQSENRVYHSFFWFAKVDGVDGVVFDVLKEGGAEKAIELWEKTLQRRDNTEDRAKEELDAVLDEILIPYLCDHYDMAVTLADKPKTVVLRKSLLHHIKTIIADFTNSRDDTFPTFHEIDAVDDSGRKIELDMGSIRSKYGALFKDIVTYNLALSSKQFTHAKNLAVLYLGLSLQDNRLNTHYLDRGLFLSGRMFHSFDSSSHYVASIAGSPHQFNLNGAATFYADEILRSLEQFLGETINNELKEIINSFRSFPKEVELRVIEKLTERPLRGIKNKVATTKQKRNDNPLAANTYGEDLYSSTCKDLSILHDILTPTNLQYQQVADAVADEIVSCSIDFFNGHLREDDPIDPGRDALRLARQAESIAMDIRIKDRITNGIPVIEKWINDESIRQRRKEANPHIELIIKEIEKSSENTSNAFAEFGSITRLLDQCKPALLALRNLHRYTTLPSILVLERFADNDNHWNENDTSLFIKNIVDEQYCLENQHEEETYWTWNLNNIEFKNMQAFTVECSISKTDGLDDAAFGLVCAHDEIDGRQSYLSFKITPEGYYLFSIIDADKTEHHGWEKSVHISEGNGTNILRIQKTYDTLEYYINGHSIGKVSHKTHGNGIGFIVHPGVSIAVNYLYFCNVSVNGFENLLDYDFYINLSSVIARRVLDFCIRYANSTNDMQRPFELMNKIREFDMVPELRERFAQNENIISRNLHLTNDKLLSGNSRTQATKLNDAHYGLYGHTQPGAHPRTVEQQSPRKIGWVSALVIIPIVLAIIMIVGNKDQTSQKNVSPPVRKLETSNPESPNPKTIPSSRSPLPEIVKSGLKERPLPKNASVKIFTGAERVAPFKIIAGQGHSSLVKLVDVGTNKDVMTIFVRKGQTVDTKVPLGTYQVKYVSGDVWYGFGKKELFGPNGVYGKAEKEFVFQILGNQVSGYSITLYQVAHGNLQTRSLSANEF